MRWLGGVVVALAATGCEAQVDGDYGGDPLLVLSGVLIGAPGSSVDSLLLRWSGDDPLGPGEQESRMRVELPSLGGWAAELLAAPPEGARRRLARASRASPRGISSRWRRTGPRSAPTPSGRCCGSSATRGRAP